MMTQSEPRVAAVRSQFDEKKIDAALVVKPENVGYLSNFTGSAGVLFLTRDESYLLTDFRYVEQATAQAPGFTVIRHDPRGALVDVAALAVKHGVKAIGFEGDFLTYDLHQSYRKELDEQIELVAASGLVETIRQVKDAEEIALMRKAAQIADQAFEQILAFIKPGVTERQVALELEFIMKRAGSTGLAFDTIVASGVRSALPHGVASDKVIEAGDLVTMDFGAVYQGYRSDMTRTVVVGEPTEEQRRIYAIVLEAQMRGVAAARAGMTGKELDAVCRTYITEQGYGEQFGHGTGHGVGRYIHEGPSVSVRGATSLQPGMVVTIEPGVYLSGWGGVRIEDMVLLTADGCERLSRSPKELIILK